MTDNPPRPADGEGALPIDFRLLFEASPTPFLVLAPEGFTCVAANDAYLKATGVRRDEVIGRAFLELLAGEPGDPGGDGTHALRASLERVLETGGADVMSVLRYELRGASTDGRGTDGRWWSPVNAPVRGAGGEIVAIIHRIEEVNGAAHLQEGGGPDQLARDRESTVHRLRETTAALARAEAALVESERSRAEAALRESEGKFRTITDLVPDLLWSSDASGSATWYNRRWTEYTGLSLDQSLGDGWVVAIHPEDREGTLRVFQAALESGSPIRHELQLRGADTNYRWFLLEARPDRDESGGIRQWFGALTDVHQQRLALEAAQQASQAKSQFLAVMSHELRTPLSGVISYSDLLEAGLYGPVTDKQHEALARIKANSWHLVSIIDEILTLSQAESGRLEVKSEEADLAELVREVAHILEPEAGRRGLGLWVETPEGSVPLRTDPGKVRQILINLVGNAVKYTEQGEVSVSIERSPLGPLHVHVRDTGPGIAPEDHEQIFQPFTQVDASHTRTAGGTGLGLAISRRLARLLNGDIELRSAPGEGSTFTLVLAAAPAEA